MFAWSNFNLFQHGVDANCYHYEFYMDEHYSVTRQMLSSLKCPFIFQAWVAITIAGVASSVFFMSLWSKGVHKFVLLSYTVFFSLFRVKTSIFPTLKTGTIEPFVTSSFLTSPNCFDKQLIQQGQIHQYVCPFWISTKFWQSYTRKNVANFGCKVGAH